MNTKIVRLALALLLALGMLGVSTRAAQAVLPDHFSWQDAQTITVEGLCEGFPVEVYYEVTGSGTAHFNQEGELVMVTVHIYEVDVLTANGKTVQGLPSVYNSQFLYDSEENVISAKSTGVGPKFLLPDGSLFVTAGFTDWLLHPDEEYLLTADRGITGDTTALCAALAP